MLYFKLQKGKDDYYLEKFKENGKEVYALINVTNEGIRQLTLNEASNLINELFHKKNLKYIDKYNDYDVYLDEVNNKRFFKNGIEDFNMLFINNGTDATLYFVSKKVINTIKKFDFIFGGGLIAMFLTSFGLSSFVDFINDVTDVSKSVSYSIEAHINDYTPVNCESIKDYIYNSKILHDNEKDSLYNEDLVEKALKYSDNKRIEYEFNHRLNELSIESYPKKQNPNTVGYYSQSNTIYVLDEVYNKKDENYYTYQKVLRHEFTHLLQSSSKYCYLKEALSDILLMEYYGYSFNELAYQDLVKRTSILIELIGPEPMMKLCFGSDETNLREKISEYLGDETRNLLELLSDRGIYELETQKEINKKVDYYLAKIYFNKNNSDIKDDIHIQNIYKGVLGNRCYFNEKNGLFYSPLQYEITSRNNIQDILLEKNIVSGKIQSISIPKEQYIALLNDEKGAEYFSQFQTTEFFETENNNGGGMKEVVETVVFSNSNRIYDAHNLNDDYGINLDNNSFNAKYTLYFDDGSYAIGPQEDNLYELHVKDKIVPSVQEMFYSGTNTKQK